MADSYYVSIFCLHYYRAFLNSAYSQNGYLRLADYRRAHQAAESAHVGHSESTALRIVCLQLVGACGICQAVHIASKAEHIFGISIFNYRYYQVAAWQGCSHTYIYVLLNNNLVAIYTCVDHRELADAIHNSLNEYRGKRDFFVILFLELTFHLVAPVHNIGHISLCKAGNVGGCSFTTYHMVSYQLTHTVHFHYFY